MAQNRRAGEKVALGQDKQKAYIIFSGNFRKGNHTPPAVVCRPPSSPTFCSFLWESTHARSLSLSHARVRVAKTLPSISVLKKKRSVETQFGTSFRKVSFLKLYAAKGDFFETIITLKEKKQSYQCCLASFAQISLLSLARRRLILLEILLINNFESTNERNLISKGIRHFRKILCGRSPCNDFQRNIFFYNLL